MSIELTNLVWESDIQPLPKRMVMLALADAANDEGVCWPGVDGLVQRVGAGRSTIVQYLSELVDDGYVSRQRRRSRSNVYTIIRDRFESVGMSRSRTIQEPDKPVAGQSRSRTRGVQELDIGKSRSRTFLKGTTKEPSRNPKGRRVEVYSETFEAWWKLYPKRGDSKGSKFEASKSWAKALMLTSAEELTAAVRVYAVSQRVVDGFAKDAVVWLNQRCWEEFTSHETPEDLRAWLNEEWRAGRVAAIEQRTGLIYRQPDIPPHVTDRTAIDAWLLEQSKRWIADNRELITERLAARRTA